MMYNLACYFKWEADYYYASFDWELINMIPYECTTEIYLHSLQYKILHRYFPCNYNLHLWSVIDSNQCVHCDDIDTLGHYFAECQVVKVFWKSLKTWFLRTFEFVINFTTLDILLGIPNYDKNNDVTNLNFIILFAKNYIYTCKKNSIPIDFYKFQVNLKTPMIIEEFRSNMYNKSLEFQQKWSVLADSLG